MRAGAGLSLGGGASAGVSVGGPSSAGISASAGAFAGLRQPRKTRPAALDVERFTQPRASLSAATGRGASFGLDGRARLGVSGSLRSDVGGETSLQSRIQFEED